jgi:hypothetical protein
MPESIPAAEAMTGSVGIQIVVLNALVGMAVGIGLAFVLRTIFTRVPRARTVVEFLPWRSAVVIAMLWATPNSWLSIRDDPMRTLVSGILDVGSMEALAWVPSAFAVSTLFFAITISVLMHHWFSQTLPQRASALLRSGVLVATVWILLQQMLFGTGMGGDLTEAYYVFSRSEISAAWARIWSTVFGIDMLFGTLQLIANLWTNNRARSAASV